MKKYLFIYIVFFACSLNAYAGEGTGHRKGWEQYGLKGKVKLLREIDYSAVIRIKDTLIGDSISYTATTVFNEKGNEMGFIAYRDSNIDQRASYYYSTLGYLTIDSDFAYEDDTLYSTTIKWYDDKENSVRLKEIIAGTAKPILVSSLIKYNGDNMVEEYTYADDKPSEKTRSIYTYDANGNKLKCIHQWDHDTVMRISSSYKYDAQGNCTEIIMFNKDGTIWKQVMEKYDEKGNDTENIEYDTHGKINSKETYVYDTTGNIISSTSYQVNRYYGGENIVNQTSKYEYDAQGNQVKVVNYMGNRASSIVVYEIVYY